MFSGGYDGIIVTWDIGSHQGTAYELTGHRLVCLGCSHCIKGLRLASSITFCMGSYINDVRNSIMFVLYFPFVSCPAVILICVCCSGCIKALAYAKSSHKLISAADDGKLAAWDLDSERQEVCTCFVYTCFVCV